ncbi:MAG: YwiC-like family protein [Candidatus Planktophila sp.]|nr:YwiC-like family protein [Candidatus Planktophila sp.]
MKFPPQHGAWAFLIVPLLLGSFLGAGNAIGLLFSLTWIAAYPFSYFGGRAFLARVNRGSWTTRARNELRSAIPWAGLTLFGTGTLIAMRPWILLPSALIVVLWSISICLTWLGRERGITNDLLLVVLASMAPILMYAVANDQQSLDLIPHSIWIATLVSLLFFIGSVLHVKALIREATNRRWHVISVGFHVAVVISLGLTTLSWWLITPFTFALVRTVLMKPGMRPGRIGAIELAVALLVVICTVIAQG